MQRYAQFLFFRKMSRTSFSTTFLSHVWFFKKTVSRVTFYQLTKFHCLITFTCWDIGQCVLQLFVNQAVTSQNLKLTLSFLPSWPKSQDKNLNILRTKRAFEVKYKAFFITFKRLSDDKNDLKPESAPLTH